MADFDCVVIGAGILGVASAHLVALEGRSVAVLERHARPGMETSSRNSGVIHASLHHPPGSLKALTCAEGRRLLYERCARFSIPHQKTGKLVVATSQTEVSRLDSIVERARNNDAGNVRLIDAAEARRLEPHIVCEGALLSPETGIVDVHELVYSHKKEASERGAIFSFGTKLEGLEQRPEGWRVSCQGADGERFSIDCRVLVNAAGLHAPEVAALGGVDVSAAGLTYRYLKGDYFTLAQKYRGRFSRLIYPVPAGGGLGVHLTFDLSGQVTAGPDATSVTDLTYDVDPKKKSSFVQALRRYLPGVNEADLEPAYSGIRPQLRGSVDDFRDFVVEDLAALGAPRMIGLIGIESPGITASEALARRVVRIIRAYD